MRQFFKLAVTSAGAVAVLGCTAVPDNEANDVTVVTADFAFKGPQELPAGVTTFRLVNAGREWHHLQLVRLEQDKTVADLMAVLQEGNHEALPTWAVMVGGPNAAISGGASEATVSLEPGRYAMVCVIPSADGVPHFAKGMVAEFTVTANRRTRGTAPREELTMTLKDYGFELSAPITAGRTRIRVDNAATQPHEVAIFRLEPGKTAHDVLSWFDGGAVGPAPGYPVGGTVGLQKGQTNLITIDFAPGNYGLICFFPDANDGAPHFVHGMISNLTVS